MRKNFRRNNENTGHEVIFIEDLYIDDAFFFDPDDFRPLFTNMFVETHNIQEIVDPETNKHYLLHVNTYIPHDDDIMAGTICTSLFLTVSDPDVDIMLNIGAKAFPIGMMETIHALNSALSGFINECLYEGIAKFEDIMDSINKGCHR